MSFVLPTADIFTLTVRGDAMESSDCKNSMPDGSLIVCKTVRPAFHPHPQAAYVARLFKRNLTVKKLRENGDGTLTVSGNNKRFVSVTLLRAEVEIIAVVVGIWNECPFWQMFL